MNYKNFFGGERNPFTIAAAEGNLGMVQFLLEQKINVDSKNFNESTALIEASKYGHHEIVKLLLEHKAKVNEKDCDGNTALIWATDLHIICFKNNFLKVAALLLEYKANISLCNYSGHDALLKATSTKNIEMVDLLNKSININTQNAHRPLF